MKTEAEIYEQVQILKSIIEVAKKEGLTIPHDVTYTLLAFLWVLEALD